MIEKEYYDKIKQDFTLDDIFSILEYFDGRPILFKNHIQSRTICHNGDSHKLYYYNNTKLFKCYTGCSDDTFDIYDLIRKIYDLKGQKIGRGQVLTVITNILHKNIMPLSFISNNAEKPLYKYQEQLLRQESLNQEEYQFTSYDNTILNYLDEAIVTDWIREGISPQTQIKYGIRFYPTKGQIVIPHYDIDNNLIGIRCRQLDDDDCKLYGKYRPLNIEGISYAHPLSMMLYGINFSLSAILKTHRAIIFESEKSVLMYDSYFGSKNNIAVACCGSYISKHQVDLLLKLGVTEIIIALDRQYQELDDKENNVYIRNLFKNINKIYNYCNVSVIYDKGHLLNYKDSPIDRGKDIFIKLFNNRIKITENILEQGV